MNRHSPLALALVLALGALALEARLAYADSPRLSIVERSDFSRYFDDRYADHVYREGRGYFDSEADSTLSGEVYILEESLHDASFSSRAVAEALPAALRRSADGGFDVAREAGFPSLRGLEPRPPEGWQPGQKWTAPTSYAFRMDASPGYALIAILVEYSQGQETLLAGERVTQVHARFALRYTASSPRLPVLDAAGLASLQGSHELDLFLDAQGSLVYVRDRFDELLAMAKGPSERRRGFSLAFFRGLAQPDRGAEIAAVEAAGNAGKDSAPSSPQEPLAGGDEGLRSTGPGELIAGENGSLLDDASPLTAARVDLLPTDGGLVFRVRDLAFAPDSDDLLPSEGRRLDALYQALAALPGRSFLVEGHSASVGKPAGELELSARRAKRVVDELVGRGLAASRFIYRGLGSAKPIAPNDTEEGRAKNRRVEITLLE